MMFQNHNFTTFKVKILAKISIYINTGLIGPDSEKCEEFLLERTHYLSDILWQEWKHRTKYFFYLYLRLNPGCKKNSDILLTFHFSLGCLFQRNFGIEAVVSDLCFFLGLIFQVKFNFLKIT